MLTLRIVAIHDLPCGEVTVFKKCFHMANYVPMNGGLMLLRGFGKDLSCMLPYAPVAMKFSENENDLSHMEMATR